MNLSSTEVSDHQILNSLNELYETFVYFFGQGAPAERYLGSEDAFQRLVTAMEDKNMRAHVRYF